MTDANYTDDLALLANIPTQVESLGHNQEQATGGIDLYVNTNKTKFMCLNKKATSPLLMARLK